ncbi:hypothetical protein COO60DRAFT_1497089 [Scenedesmus sp. NREL 46B-D3]|nr:hypothetical protein COO60DRAFT_1497089 [Scenedesmus sp. NREL 46B-D3]
MGVTWYASIVPSCCCWTSLLGPGWLRTESFAAVSFAAATAAAADLVSLPCRPSECCCLRLLLHGCSLAALSLQPAGCSGLANMPLRSSKLAQSCSSAGTVDMVLGRACCYSQGALVQFRRCTGTLSGTARSRRPEVHSLLHLPATALAGGAGRRWGRCFVQLGSAAQRRTR